MDWTIIVAGAIGGVISVLAALAQLTGYSLRDLLGKRDKAEETLEHRVEQLSKALSNATALISDIEKEITSRHALATKLESDLETYNHLVELKRSEVEAVAQLLRGELRSQERRGFWQEVLVNFVFFVLGVVTTLLLT
jgi:peptidoglycan hydrolase CwlO-like protein